jgi:hypothetical protein
MLSVGDVVTYTTFETEHPPRGRLIQRLADQGGEHVWLVAWKGADGREQRLKTPERSLRPLPPR